MRPKIAIPMCVSPDEATNKSIPEKAPFEYVKRTFMQRIYDSGGAPMPVPVIDEPEFVRYWTNLADGLFLIGGLDIHPKFFGEENRHAERITEDRDRIELELAKSFLNAGKPIFGICRGIQLLAVAFGGSLYQDYSENSEYHEHSQNGYEFRFHEVRIEPNTMLFDIIKKERIQVNSSHHQMVKKVPPKFKVSATSIPDGVIEALEYEQVSTQFVLGVQWHPEELSDEVSERLFAAFTSACASA